MKSIKDHLFSLLFSVSLFFFIITFSIALPIYIRPFYYLHIDALNLTDSGFTKQEIIDSYDSVLDYLTLPDKEFSTGVMKHSETGAAHFKDCKVLFDLNATVLLVSAVICLLLLILKRRKIITLSLKKRSAAFYSAITAVIIPVLVGGFAALNFNKAFVLFHSIFFAGKDNWIFKEHLDEIITVLPEQFFMNCAILIGVSILLFSALIITHEFICNHDYRLGR